MEWAMLGYAVIDCETTGLNRTGSDRIAEIAVATFDMNFNLTGKYETLINPEQDLGMTSLHGITGLMAANAPHFEEIMPSLGHLLHDRILIGHGVEFDLRFIAHEYEKQGIDIWWKASYLDTLTLAKNARLATENNQLSTLCAYLDIPLLHAHSAMDDVMATTELFQALIEIKYSEIPSLVSSPFSFPSEQLPMSNDFSNWMSRKAVDEIIHAPYDWHMFLDSLPSSSEEMLPPHIHSYLTTLHLSLINDSYSYKERETMEELITMFSLSRNQVIDLNEEYLFLLLCHNLTHSGSVLQSDFSTMRTAIEFTGIREDRVKQLLAETLENKHVIPNGLLTLKSLFSLNEGDGLVISGEEFSKGKRYLKFKLEDSGFAVLSHTTKSGTKAVICNDPYSLSNKAVTARRFGIPILTENTFMRLALQDQ
jgi:DNA polymerase-3 subunit epsilon